MSDHTPYKDMKIEDVPVPSEKKGIQMLDKAMDALSVRREEEDGITPDQLARKSIRFGVATIFIFLAVFIVWGVLAPIDSAAVAPGRVILEGNKKTINHLEGGVIEAVMVREGQTIEAGDILLTLDATSAEARQDMLRSQFIAAKAQQERLIAERDAEERLAFSDMLLAERNENAVVAQNLDAQERLFSSRRDALVGQQRVLQQQVRQFQEEINGLRTQIGSANDQIRLLNEEIAGVRTLVEKGLASRPRLLSLERAAADLRGQRGENQARIARAQQSISETEIQILNVQTQFKNEVVEQLRETERELANLDEQLKSAESIVGRIEIKSPITGIVTDMEVLTIGSSIAPNARLMDIIPINDNLIVEAKVSPQDIDVVHTDLLAQVRLTAYKMRNVPPLNGTVVNVSADRFDDPATGESFFKARIMIEAEQLSQLDNVMLTPGMPADTLIITGERTFFAYLFSPITDSFNKAFREQ